MNTCLSSVGGSVLISASSSLRAPASASSFAFLARSGSGGSAFAIFSVSSETMALRISCTTRSATGKL